MPGMHFAEPRARIAPADVLDLHGSVPCEPSGPRPVFGASFELAIEPQLFREPGTTCLQMLEMRIARVSTGPIRRSDGAESLRRDGGAVRAASPRSPVDGPWETTAASAIGSLRPADTEGARARPVIGQGP